MSVKSPRKAYEDAKVHLHVLGEEHEIECKVRVGRTQLHELLPLARSLSASILAISTAHARAQGKEISCQKGCTHCCRQLVPASPIEARRLGEVVAAMPEPRRAEVRERFVRAIERLEQAGLVDPRAPKGRSSLVSKEATSSAAWDDVSRRYYELRIDCPFLEGDLCSIYEERPIACREYNAVTDPALCEALDPGIEIAPRPSPMGDVLTKATGELTGKRQAGIPLPLALEWARVHGKTVERERDGEAMFWALLRVMEEDGA
ncbi:YkgJ family cysteine cluster protein [Polyangium fumosum]|uniref:YkgJ family cysteine cluster protein n=1 Tax=Polyangium fumosum TaxID=889272 RepID=UPI001479156B|nr:YkgJ family cysteine cluster protein [Polyangium fumosum]